MHGLHKPFPLGGAPAKGQSRCAVDREQSTVEMLSCNKLYPGKCMRPGQDEVIKDPRRRGLFRLWLARTAAGKGQERKRTKGNEKDINGKERSGKERAGKKEREKERIGKEREGRERKRHKPRDLDEEKRKGKEREGKARKGKGRKGNDRTERIGKERNGKERKRERQERKGCRTVDADEEERKGKGKER